MKDNDTHPSSPRRSRGRLIALAVVFLGSLPAVVILGIYLGSVYSRGRVIYKYLKTNQRGWEGEVHAVNPVLGFAPIPDSRGAHIFPIGPKIPMRYDSRGFRVPVEAEDRRPDQRPMVLSLGGSFTYGDAVPAEKTFPYLVGKDLNGSSINAGVCSYGLAEMLLVARELIPEYQPDYVLVQASSWLPKRAIRPFAPIYYGLLPSPYYYENNQGELSIQPPVFSTIVFRLPVSEYRQSPDAFMDFLSFYFRVALPLYIHDDFYIALYRIKSGLGLLPPPYSDPNRVAGEVYREIRDLTRDHGGIMIIVYLPWWARPVKVPPYIPSEGVPIADTQIPLLAKLPPYKKRSNFRWKYCHYRGDPPKLVDRHPNSDAHRIIADNVLKTIQQAEGKNK